MTYNTNCFLKSRPFVVMKRFTCKYMVIYNYNLINCSFEKKKSDND